MASDERDPRELGRLLGLVVHDLRNPASAIGANLAYLKEVGGGAGDAGGALEDAESAVGDLMRGLEQVAWIARWLQDQPAAEPTDADAASALRAAASKHAGLDVRVEVRDEPLPVQGGGTLVRLLEVLLANSAQHAPRGPVVMGARREGTDVIVEVRDSGAAVAPELRPVAFTLAGQQALKGRADGRYGRVGALFAARILADAMGARLEADGEDGAAILRIVLPLRSS